MNQRILPQPRTAVQELEPSPIELRIDHLYKSFGSNQALETLALVVHSAQIVAIAGGSGSGKTTLLRKIIGLEHPERGRVLANHEAKGSPLVDLATLKQAGMAAIQRHWGVVFQGPRAMKYRNFPGLTACDNC